MVADSDERPDRNSSSEDGRRRDDQREPIQGATAWGVISGGEWIGPDDAGLFSADEYFRALCQKWTEEDAREIIADELENNSFDKRGTVWDDYALRLVAMLSPEHRARIQRHRRWTDEEADQKLAWVRSHSPYPPV